ncbi:MAG TPA: xanthine dehydrogenase family protein subunit M [Gaiellaceae bacterium]|nr:xanthine dehydrogenase family protein subunit M [Gaiellaceae bacterium]
MPELFVPESLDDAVAFLAAHVGSALPVAGGTDVLIDARVGRTSPEWLVDLTLLRSLADTQLAGEVLRLGALATIRSLELDPELARRAAALVEAARVLGSVQIRTMATVGGNLCHATPSAEMPPALLVHDAVAEVAGPGGERSLPLGELFAGPGRTTLDPGELLTAVSLRVPAASAGSCYLRQTVRWSMDLAGVGVAASVEVDGTTVTRARIALGAVAPVPLLVAAAADAVVGTECSAADAEEAGARAAAACSPITDARGTAEYRRQVVAVLVPRALHISWLRATGSWPAGVPAPINGVLPRDAA